MSAELKQADAGGDFALAIARHVILRYHRQLHSEIFLCDLGNRIEHSVETNTLSAGNWQCYETGHDVIVTGVF